jgi:Bacterial Ig-like domain
MQPDPDIMLIALRDCRQSSLKRGQWQAECSLEYLAKVVGVDVSRAAHQFGALVDKGYIHGWIRRKPNEWLSTKAQRVRNFVSKLDDVRLDPAVIVESLTDEGMKRIDVSPEHERRLDTLRALYGLRHSSLKRGQWRTECKLEDLAKVAGLDILTTADLLANLIDEGYLRGHLLYERLTSSGEIPPGPPDESNLVPYEELEPFEKRLACPASAEIEGLTEKGLVAIDELPDPTDEEQPGPQLEGTVNPAATFPSELDPASINTSTFTLAEQNSGEQVAAGVTYDPTTKTATLDPGSDLKPGTTYEATIKGGFTGVKDKEGNRLKEDRTWTVPGGQAATPPVPIVLDTSKSLSDLLHPQYHYGNLVTKVSNTGENIGEKTEESSEYVVGPVVGAVAAFVGLLFPLAYPAGLVALWIQVSNQYAYGPWKALYAASLAPSAMVVGKVTWILAFACLSALVPMWFWYAYARARVRIEDSELSKVQRFRNPLIIVFAVYAFVLFVVCLWRFSAATDLWDFSLVSLFLFFTVVEVFLGGVFLFLRGIRAAKWEAARNSLYLGLVVVYLGSVAAGVCLAGLQSPDLPTTEITLNGPKGSEDQFRVGILSNSNGYWYVVKYCKDDKFVAVPNAKVDHIDTLVDEPIAPQKTHSRENCDITEPKTSLYSGPSDPTADDTPTFAFGGEDNLTKKTDLLFSHKVDHGDWSEYRKATRAEPADTTGLDEGSHTFEVRAKDAAGNHDTDPASRTFVVDTLGPNTTIDSGPKGEVASTVARFDYSSSEKNSTFKCSLDGSPFTQCGSSHRYLGLSDGKHTFAVEAIDAAGNSDNDPARRTWTVC